MAEQGHAQAALDVIAGVLREHPRSVAALKLQGMVLDGVGDEQGAAAAYEQALALAPSDPDLELNVGVAKLVQGDANAAVDLLKKRAEALPQDYEGRYYLAQAYHRMGKDDLALATIHRADELAPDNASVAQKYGELLCTTGDSEHALPVLERAQKEDPTLPRIAFDLAVAHYDNQQLDQAVTYAQQEVQAVPQDVEAEALLGSALAKLGRWAEAKPVLEAAVQAQPNDAASLLKLGECEIELKDDQAAVTTIQQALAIDPTRPQGHFLLARAYAALGRTADAKYEADLHQRLMQEDSFQVPAAQRRQQEALVAHVRSLLGDGREEDALRVVEKTGKTSAAAYVFLGSVYLGMGKADETKRCEERALKENPGEKGAHLYLGLVALDAGDLNIADKELRAELAVEPNHPVVLAVMGEVRYREQRWADAVAYLMQSKSPSPRYLYMLADAYFHEGNTDAADLTAEAMATYARAQPQAMTDLVDLLNRNGQAALAAKLATP